MAEIRRRRDTFIASVRKLSFCYSVIIRAMLQRSISDVALRRVIQTLQLRAEVSVLLSCFVWHFGHIVAVYFFAEFDTLM